MSRRLPPTIAAVGLSVLLTVGLSACMTGQRPSFATTSTDPAVEAVAARLERVDTAPFTARYSVLTKFGNTTQPASVTVDGSNREIVVGTVRFVDNDGTAVTCTFGDVSTCSPDFQPQRISDTLITPDFYGTDTGRRLRRDGDALVGPAVERTDTIAGQPVECLDLPLSGGTAVYCVLANGALALLDDGDVRVELTSFSATADPFAFGIAPG